MLHFERKTYTCSHNEGAGTLDCTIRLGTQRLIDSYTVNEPVILCNKITLLFRFNMFLFKQKGWTILQIRCFWYSKTTRDVQPVEETTCTHRVQKRYKPPNIAANSERRV